MGRLLRTWQAASTRVALAVLCVTVVFLAAARCGQPHRGATATASHKSALEAVPVDIYLDHDVLIAGGRAASESGKRLGAPADPNDGKTPKGRPEFELIVEGTLRLGGDSARHVTYPPAGEDGGEWSGIVFADGDAGSWSETLSKWAGSVNAVGR
jgi:hypothetical protein